MEFNSGKLKGFRVFVDGIFSFILFSLILKRVLSQFSYEIRIYGSVAMSLILVYIYLYSTVSSYGKSRETENMKNAFLFEIKNEVEYVAGALSKKYNVKIENGVIYTDNFCVYVRFPSLNVNALSEIYRKRKCDKIVILTFDTDKKTLRTANRLNGDIKIFDSKQTYKLLSFLHSLPVFGGFRKIKLRELLPSSSFKVSLSYLFSAFVIFTLSPFVKFSLYYKIFAVFILALSIIPTLVKAIADRSR